MPKKYIFFFLCVSILISCKESADIRDWDSGNIILRLTDAPFPHDQVSEVKVTISNIKLIADSPSVKAASSEEHLMQQSVTVNLLQLTNGVTMTLLNSSYEAGQYLGVEINIDKVVIIMKNGRHFGLNLGNRDPSENSLRVNQGFEIVPGLTTDLLLDFDVARSFIPRYGATATDEIHDFLYSPVLKLSNALESGSISGIVTSSLENKISRLGGAQVTVLSNGMVYTTTFTDISGMYTVLGLAPGFYDLEVRIQGFEPQLVEKVQVYSSQQTKQGILLSQPF